MATRIRQLTERVFALRPAAASPTLSEPPLPPVATGEMRRLVLVIGPQRETLAELRGIAAEALPVDAAVVCADAASAVAKAEQARTLGWTPAIAVVDYRGAGPADLGRQLRTLREKAEALQLLVLIDEREMDLWRAALQVVQAPDKLTFLLAPYYRPDAVATIRGLADRHRSLGDLSEVSARGRSAVEALESKVQTLTVELQIAQHAAHHDVLTGILNRAGFIEELSARLARGRHEQTLLLVDLDRFKAVNDTLGHHAGDDLVKKICAAMAGVLPRGGVLARLGGDEFGIIVEEASDLGLDEFCKQILRVCAQGRRIMGHEVQVSASIGVARQGETRSEVAMMRRADLALYAAKREGRNRYRMFDADLEKAAEYRLSLESGLEQALRAGAFRMVYQPIVSAREGHVLGFEALVRWKSHEHGDISPATFVPVAEETGLILDLGDWITRQALKDCRRWGGPYVSVNLSARQFLHRNVAERILRYAEEADLPPSRIQIELTETALIDDVERAGHNLKVLREAGVRVALDDFGTGYSSLTYLHQFALDCIKIDKSFVDNIASDPQSSIIVSSVTQLASQLGMGVVAEGVETEAQQTLLVAAGCGALQGYRFGRPMPPLEAKALIGAPRPEPTAEPRRLLRAANLGRASLMAPAAE